MVYLWRWRIGYGGDGYASSRIISASGIMRDSRPSTIKFMEDNPSQQFIQDIEVCDASLLNENDVVTIAVGEPDSRTKIRKKCQSLGVKLASVFSANAYISEYSLVGNGAIIAPFCSIQATSVIGDNVLINSSSIIGHDLRVEKDSVISSAVNIGGNTHIGFASFLGMRPKSKRGSQLGMKLLCLWVQLLPEICQIQ